MRHDLLHGLRLLLRQPGFSLTAILTLALGVGANAAVFAVAWQLFLKPLPWPDAGRIVQLWNTFKSAGSINVFAPANYLDIEREAQSFEAVAAYNYFPYTLNLTGEGDPLELRIRAVTAEYFRVFGTTPLAGRTMTADETRDASRVVVLAEGLWTRRFDADPRIIGTTIPLDGRPHEVIGIMPASFDVGARPLDGWVPYPFTAQAREIRRGYYLAAVGRLKPGVTLEQARGELDAIAARASARYPESNANIGITARTLREELVGSIRNGVLMLAGAAALVLLVACANLTSLQLARGAGRERELAVRAALGATRMRLVRLLLLENAMLSLVAGYAGAMAALWTIRALAASAPPSAAIAGAFTFEPVVPVFAFVIAVAAGLVFALGPAWRATRPARAEALRGRTTMGRSGGRIRATLVTAEVAMATILLVSASVLVVSMIRVLRVDPGFDPSGVIAANLRLPPARYPDLAAQSLLFENVFERLRAIPGVEAVCATNTVPFETAGTMTYVPDGTRTLVAALPVTVSPECFRTLQIRLVTGRLFAGHEPEPVAVVSEGFARRAFPGTHAVGRTIRIGLPTGDPLTIVGIVEETRRVSLEAEPFGQVYQLATQPGSFRAERLLVRATGPTGPYVAAMQQALREADPSLPLGNIRTLAQVADRSLGPRRFNLELLGGFAAIALALAAIGIYGLLSELVAQRRNEIGVRVALGADPRAVIRLVTGGALGAVVAGVLLGLGGAWSVNRVLQQFAFEVSAGSLSIFAGAAVVLIAVAAAAAYLPARRAARIDPVIALRAE